MNRVTSALRGSLALIMLLAGTSCGGGNPPGSSSSGSTTVASASNVVSVVVNGGPTSTSTTVNTLYTTVTVCVPGSTTECQTIDNIQVDTGSYGLRLLAPVLTLALPIAVASNGNSLVECTTFVDGYSWGPVATADIHVSGESASSVPIQVIGDTNFTEVPDTCSSTGPSENTVASFGANGIIGIGVFAQDCGAVCTSDPANEQYYACPPAGACDGIIVSSTTALVQNPVTLFPVDNNGTIIDLPSVSQPGAATVTGSLIFGIDTQTNNASGSQTVLTLDDGGNFITIFGGQTLSTSFIDSGTNGLFFNDSDIPQCSTDTGFYCPTSTESFSATLTGQNAVSATASFSVANPETISSDDPTYTALPALAGTYSSDTTTFDWGLPFFYGRPVYTAIQGYSTKVNTGPYVAF